MKNKTIFKSKAVRSGNFIQDTIKRLIEKKLNKISNQYAINSHITAIFAHDFVGNQINLYGCFERDDLDDLFAFLEPLLSKGRKGIALDIGANIGNHSIYFSNIFSHVRAYEPNPEVYDLLKLNIQKKNNITAYNYGLGEARARAELIGVDGNRGGSFIMRDSAGANDRIPIRLQTLDTVLDDLAEDITLIKIDVEGYEAQVLRGATNTLCRHQPVVVFEQHQTEFCDGSTPSINFLRSLGYSICWAEYPRERTKYSLVREIRKLLDKINRRRPNIVFGLDIPKKSHSMMVAIPKHLKDSLGVTE